MRGRKRRWLIGTAAAAVVVAGVGIGVVPAGADTTPLSRLRAVTPSGQQYGHLVDTATGKRFVPRGANWVRVTPVTSEDDIYHSNFEPGRYTTDEAEGLLAALQRDGHNSVRVFIDPGNPQHAANGKPHGLGRGMNHDRPLYGPYMKNVADFVRRATAHKVRVMFSLDHFPQNKYYYDIVGPVNRPEVNMDGRNLEYLHPTYVKAKRTYLRNFAHGLKARVGPELMSTVLAFQTDNEAYVVGDKMPYNKMSGAVTTMNGLTYDMADPTQRQQSADANFVEYANRMVEAVHTVDPKALVTMGMFTYGAVGKPGPQGMPLVCETNCDGDGNDYRYPVRPRSLSQWSNLDFLDVHIYPGHKPGINDPYTLDRNLDTIEWDHVTGPVIVGEFGAHKPFYGNDISKAAYGMRDMQVESCQRGMSGWLFWTHNSGDTELLRQFYSLQDENGAINGQLAPIVRPDPCVA